MWLSHDFSSEWHEHQQKLVDSLAEMVRQNYFNLSDNWKRNFEWCSMIHFAGVVCVWGGEPARVYSQEPHFRESSKCFWCPFFPSPTLPPQGMHSHYSPLLLPVFFHLSSPSQVNKISLLSLKCTHSLSPLTTTSSVHTLTSYSGDIRVRRRGSRWDRKKIHQRHIRILAVIKSHTSSPSFLSFIYCTFTIIVP